MLNIINRPRQGLQMAKEKSMRAELDALRREVEEMREQRKAEPPLQPESDVGSSVNDVAEELESVAAGAFGNVESSLHQLAELSEKEIEKNPRLAVGLAFLVGLMVGRASKF